MILQFRCLAAAALMAVAFISSAAAATLPYTGLFAFGDSLTDNGNAYRLSFGQAPESPPYYKGRFSNGPNWYDRVARKFRAEDLETRNYAIGGAHAATNLDPIPDLRAQRGVFRDRADPGAAPLAAIFAGGNDLLAHIGESGLRRTARAAADAVTDTASALHRHGVDAALIFNLPNLADIPRYAEADRGKRRQAARASRKFNARLAVGVSGLRADGLEVIEVDTFALFKDVVAHPAAYGIDNLTEPCLQDGRNVCSAAEARRSAFFDTLHPSAKLHRILGRHVLDLLTPPAFATLLDEAGTSGAKLGTAPPSGSRAAVAAVPLPASALVLLAAIGGLVWIARPLQVRTAGNAA